MKLQIKSKSPRTTIFLMTRGFCFFKWPKPLKGTEPKWPETLKGTYPYRCWPPHSTKINDCTISDRCFARNMTIPKNSHLTTLPKPKADSTTPSYSTPQPNALSTSKNPPLRHKTILKFQTISLSYLQQTISTYFLNLYYTFCQNSKDFSEFDEITVPQTQMISKSTVRKYLLISLNDVDKNSPFTLTAEDVVARLNRLFLCKSIICRFKKESENQRHINVGIRNETASKNTVRNILRKARARRATNSHKHLQNLERRVPLYFR